MIDSIQVAATACNENAFTDVIDERLFLELPFQQIERLPEPKVNDRVQRLALDLLAGEARIVLQEDRLARQAIPEGDAAFFDLQLLRAGHRNSQSHRDVVRDVVPADGEDAALFHGPVDIQNVVAGS